MVRKVAFASVASLLVLIACSDDDEGGDGGAGSSGKGGLAGSAGSAGSGGVSGAGRAGAPAGGVAPSGGRGGSTGTGDTAGEVGAGAPPELGGAGGEGPSPPPSGDAGAGGSAPDLSSGGIGGEAPIEAGEAGEAGEGGEGGAASGPVGPVGLVARFSFDENTGTTAADSTGHFGPATLAQEAGWTSGRKGTSGVELGVPATSGNNPHVVLPAAMLGGLERATIATWVNFTSHQAWSRIFDFNSPGGFSYLADNPGYDGFRFSVYTGDAATESSLLSSFAFPLGVWKHVAVTIDGTKHTLFVDGYPVSHTDTARTLKEIAPFMNAWLGKSTFPDPYLKGKLDDFQIHDVVLTQPQIADLAWPDNDYSYLRFDETTGTVLTDSSSRDFDGTILNAATFTTGHVGGALELAGGASDSTTAPYVVLDPEVMANCDDLTIALWAKLDTVGDWTHFINLGGAAGNFLYFTPGFPEDSTQKLRFTIYKDVDSLIVGSYPAETDLSEWHHYAVTLSGTTARLYFDGAQIAEDTAQTLKPSDLELGNAPFTWIGRSLFPDPYLDGALDELRIACRALTAAEIGMLASK